MRWQKHNHEVINQNREESLVIKETKYHNRFLIAFGLTANFFIYQAFMTGIYNHRETELLRMRRVPFVLKISISSSVAAYMYYLLYLDSLYNVNLYRISLKYRTQFDKGYNDFL